MASNFLLNMLTLLTGAALFICASADEDVEEVAPIRSEDSMSLLQVSVVPPSMPTMDGRLVTTGGKSVYRAVIEMLIAVFAVVVWMQLKQLHVNWAQGWKKAKGIPKVCATKESGEPCAAGTTPLHLAARQNDAKALRACAVRGDVDYRDALDRTPLHVAAATGSLECVTLLIQFGANVSAFDFSDTSPCIYAGRNGHREVVNALLDAGAVVGSNDESLPPLVAQLLLARMLSTNS
jgi:hypothetical protein